MAFCRVVFPLLVLSVVSCYASKVPLYMWGVQPVSSYRAGPLKTVSEADFNELLKEYSIGDNDDKVTVVFIEETLSVEDFSSKNSDGKTSFPYLHSELSNAVYLPSVEHALRALKERAGSSLTNIELKENGLPEDIPTQYSETGNFVFIQLKDAREGESRPEFLSRHDQFMQETVAKLQKYYDNVVAIYTAHFPSWSIAEAPVSHSRTRRAANNKSAKSYTINGLGFKVESITLVNVNETTTLGEMRTQNTEFNPTNMSSKLDFEGGQSLTLNFNRMGGYWYFDSVVLSTAVVTEPLTPLGEDVYALEGYSYRCGQHVSFGAINRTKDYTLNFVNLKIQPFFEATNETIKFGESFNCVGYFSAPIWSALLVVFILLAITFYGIMMMLDIRTMDRFDDPKGKTITINTQE